MSLSANQARREHVLAVSRDFNSQPRLSEFFFPIFFLFSESKSQIYLSSAAFVLELDLLDNGYKYPESIGQLFGPNFFPRILSVCAECIEEKLHEKNECFSCIVQWGSHFAQLVINIFLVHKSAAKMQN